MSLENETTEKLKARLKVAYTVLRWDIVDRAVNENTREGWSYDMYHWIWSHLTMDTSLISKETFSDMITEVLDILIRRGESVFVDMKMPVGGGRIY